MARTFLLTCLLACASFGCSDDTSEPEPNGDGDGDGDADGGDDGGTDAGADAGDGDGDGDAGPADPNNVWTHLGFDQSNTYFNPHEKTLSVDNAPMLEEKWSAEVGTPHGGSVIVGGRVYVTSATGVYAFALEDGDVIWQRPELVSDGTVAYADGAIYVHTQPAELWKLDAETGEPMWGPIKTYDLAGSDGTSSPVIGGDKVIVGHSAGRNEVSTAAATSFGGVEAFNTEDGEREWTYSTCTDDENGAMVWSTVTIDLEAGVVFAATGNNYTIGGGGSDAIHAIDLADGTQLWKTQVREGDTWSLLGGGTTPEGEQDTDFGANPILSTIGDRKVVAAGDKGSAFWVLDRETGEIVDSKDDLSASNAANKGGVLNNGAFDGETYYFASNDPMVNQSQLHALSADGLTAKWEQKTLMGTVWGMPSLANGLLFVPMNTELQIYDADSGELLKTFETGATIAAGAPSVAEGHIVVKSGLDYAFSGGATPGTKVFCYGLPD